MLFRERIMIIIIKIFFCEAPEECLEVLKKFEGDLWLLMDVGHFKVSSNTLNFRKKYLKT